MDIARLCDDNLEYHGIRADGPFLPEERMVKFAPRKDEVCIAMH